MENITPAMLVDLGICPTCYDLAHDRCLYGDPTERILYDNDRFSCLLITNPRAPGHTIISTKDHYKDMMELPEELCKEIFDFSRKVMIALKKVYQSESVYLCTMCDGPMNHFHVQMIPRYANERRGSKNFVKERCSYIYDEDKVTQLRSLLEK
jgi:diadenosine tetraphosphate (Ap4A) HIT family hydrolase